MKRSLTLCYSLGSALVSMQTEGRPKGHELVVSTIGMFVLLLFNDPAAQSEGLSVQQIVDALQIDEETARKNLQCLATAKYRILITKKQQPNSQSDVEMVDTSTPGKSASDDRVMLNRTFTSNLVRLTLPIPVLEEVCKKERVVQERTQAIECCIIRIMKARKRLEYSSLMNEVIEALKLFKPSPQTIKATIEKLI